VRGAEKTDVYLGEEEATVVAFEDAEKDGGMSDREGKRIVI